MNNLNAAVRFNRPDHSGQLVNSSSEPLFQVSEIHRRPKVGLVLLSAPPIPFAPSIAKYGAIFVLVKLDPEKLGAHFL